MTKNNKKGFTIVELVIVIAVIAILAAVLIPTFGGIIDSAKESAALQEATSAYKEFAATVEGSEISTGDDTIDAYIKITKNNDDYYFSVEKGEIKAVETAPETLKEEKPASTAEEQKVYVKSGTSSIYVYTVIPANT